MTFACPQKVFMRCLHLPPLKQGHLRHLVGVFEVIRRQLLRVVFVTLRLLVSALVFGLVDLPDLGYIIFLFACLLGVSSQAACTPVLAVDYAAVV